MIFERFIPFSFFVNDEKRKNQLYCLCLKMTADFGNFVAKNDEKRKMKWTRHLQLILSQTLPSSMVLYHNLVGSSENLVAEIALQLLGGWIFEWVELYGTSVIRRIIVWLRFLGVQWLLNIWLQFFLKIPNSYANFDFL